MAQAALFEASGDGTVERADIAVARSEATRDATMRALVRAGVHRHGEELSLRIALGQPALPGWVSIDVGRRPAPSAHHACSLAALSLPDGSVHALRLDRVLEHHSLISSLALLVRCSRWLAPGALLHVQAHDAEASARKVCDAQTLADDQSAFGQLCGPDAEPHRDGWHRRKLRRVLEAFGFTIETLRTRTIGTSGRHLCEASARAPKHKASALAGAKEILRESLAARPNPLILDEAWRKLLGEVGPLDGLAEEEQNVDAEQVTKLARAIEQALGAGRLDDAGSALEQLLAFVPESADVWITLATVQMQQGKLLAAERGLIKASLIGAGEPRQREDLVASFLTLARGYERAGAAPSARLNIERALRCDPNHVLARRELARLSERPAPRVSIVILALNQREQVRRCLESIAAHTELPHEIVVIDDGSSDGTLEVLREHAASRANVRIVANKKARGFAAGHNLGLALARGEHVLLLSATMIARGGWLDRMVARLDGDARAGLVAPPCAGLCMLVRRSALERVGGLDARFGGHAGAGTRMGPYRPTFEADDYCLRVRTSGFEARVAHDIPIDCAGDEADGSERSAYREALERDWNTFKSKWGIPANRAIAAGLPHIESPSEGVMDLIALPELGQEHEPDEKQQWWQEREPAIDPAIATATKMAQAAAQRPKPKSETVQLFDQAEAAAQAGDWQRAAEIFMTMIERMPTFGPGYVGLASACFALGDAEAGLIAVEQACNFYPDNASLHAQRGVALAVVGQLGKAEEAFLRVLDIDPNNLDAILSLAQICRAGRNYVEAVELLDVANRLAPTDASVIAAIGTTAFELGDHAGAQAALRRLQQMAPDHTETQILAETIGSIK